VRRVLTLLGLLVAALLLRQLLFPASYDVRRSQILLGTVVEIDLHGADASRLEAAVSEAFAEIARIEALMSPINPSSDVARLNMTTAPLAVHPETASVIAFGAELAQKSGGAFDLGLGRIKALWALESETPHHATAEELAPLLRDLGPGDVSLTDIGMAQRAPAVAVDLGGIAKGYAVDRAVAVLSRAGEVWGSVNAGGDIGFVGSRPDRLWRIGIQHPRQAGEVLATLSLEGGAVVTSGDYERFVEIEGERYHHLFDPSTGEPARRCQTVTVVADGAMLADVLATALFVLGPEKGFPLVESYHASALLVTVDGAVHTSPTLSGVTWP